MDRERGRKRGGEREVETEREITRERLREKSLNFCVFKKGGEFSLFNEEVERESGESKKK